MLADLKMLTIGARDVDHDTYRAFHQMPIMNVTLIKNLLLMSDTEYISTQIQQASTPPQQ